MTPDPQTTAWLDQEDAHLAAVIRRTRFAVQYVGPGDLPTEPAFGYTIGLSGLGHPELVVVGLDAPATHALLAAVAGEVLDGRTLVPGELLGRARGRPDLVVEECPNPGEVLLAANRWYRRPAAAPGPPPAAPRGSRPRSARTPGRSCWPRTGGTGGRPSTRYPRCSSPGPRVPAASPGTGAGEAGWPHTPPPPPRPPDPARACA